MDTLTAASLITAAGSFGFLAGSKSERKRLQQAECQKKAEKSQVKPKKKGK